MKCPLDQTELLITERQGVEIDYCPTCRGVWLDRGELDKLIERADNYDRRDRSRDDDDDRNNYGRQPQRGAAPYANPDYPPRAASSGGDLAGMVGEVLKKKLGEGKRGDYDRDYDRHHGHKKKKGGLLGELFDF
ncbi:MAG TPA: zf-TFIIB domain-containing protein [Abditibacterium sp.]|jgi:hypothetical protein